MLPTDPIIRPEPFWTRTRWVSLLIAIWFIIVAAAHYPYDVAFQVTLETLALLILLWLPLEFASYQTWGLRNPVNRHEASALDVMARILIWCLFLARIPWFIATWSVANWPESWTPDPPAPPLHFFSQ